MKNVKPELKGESTKFLSLPIAVPAHMFEVEEIKSDFVHVPVAITENAVVLSCDKIIPINTVTDLPNALSTVTHIDTDSTDDRTGYNVDLLNGNLVSVYLEHSRIKAVIRSAESSKIIQTGFVPVCELINTKQGLGIKECESIKLPTLFEKMIQSEKYDFSFHGCFNTIVTVAGIDFDVENDSYPMLKHSDGRKWLDFVEIMDELNSKGFSVAKVIECTTTDPSNISDDCPKGLKDYFFDPVLDLTLTTTSDEFDTVFKRTYESSFTLNFDSLLESAYDFLSSEFVDFATAN